MNNWRQVFRDGAVSGSIASVISTSVLSARGRQENGTPYAPTNAISHWFRFMRHSASSWRCVELQHQRCNRRGRFLLPYLMCDYSLHYGKGR
ncbi:hypothetical protein D3871_16635 [Noviherbaspirillum saxi]|uniref:Uncharacterized protein n=1 Tax=Noviherbaspirillum saxi TaxID=2320863 RepID=A0A3A3FN47_9BURK|nr:hypothetical protein D3871_16635 [Noviherbaspirillum saxi]